MPATYEPIATSTLGTAAPSVTFSSIPATYTDLRLVIFCAGTSSAGKGVAIQLNSDTGTNYSGTRIYGDGATASSARQSNFDYLFFNNTSTSTTIPTFYTVDFFSYAGSTNKTALLTGSADKNGSGAVERVVGLYRSTSAITTIKVTLYTDGSANYNTGSTFTLYGIKSAQAMTAKIADYCTIENCDKPKNRGQSGICY